MLGKERGGKGNDGCGLDSGDPRTEKCTVAKTIRRAGMSTDCVFTVRVHGNEDKRVSCCRITVAYGQRGEPCSNGPARPQTGDTLVSVCGTPS